MRLRSSLLLLAFVVCIASCKKSDDKNEPAPKPDPNPVTDYDQDETVLINDGWKKVFEDDFSADFSKWNVWHGGAFNNEYQCYTPDTSNIKTKNGLLIINVKKETVTGPVDKYSSATKSFNFTSGRIESKTAISASTATPIVRVSARIKSAAGYGMWPAFWSYGANWPVNGEIDILEARGNLPMVFATNYFYGPYASQNMVSNAEKTITSASSLVDYWHVYEVVWEKNSLTFYLDGNIVDTKLASSATGQYVDDMFGKVQNIVLNVAVGGDYFQNPAQSTIEPGTMYVDWVRVFNK